MIAQEYLKRGIEYYEKEDDKRAFDDFTEALRLDPNLAEAKKYLASLYFNRGIASYQKGDKDQAVANFTKAIEHDRTDAQYFGARAMAHAEKEDYDRSINDWTEVIRLDPNNSVPYSSRADVYYGKSKRYRLAGDKHNFSIYLQRVIDDLKEASKYNPDPGLEVQKRLELAKSEKKNREAAFEAADKISGLFGRNGFAYSAASRKNALL